ncbi:MAG: U32 family peptidase [Defluviitaleaceae bacterium]|nr:U32 family peptidase [Defluviitaleaceae bacterium]MCL2240722.1 U32 family peptidase [Defluviitaleaceae bacterium]
MGYNIVKRPELLAPAGSMSTLRAAVEAGADAVYLGAGKFSARANAQNFHGDALAEAIGYARENGVAVHLAVNTLMTDRELEEAIALVGCAYHLGAAAFIVQDIGLGARIRQAYPDAVLHASTQMTARSLEDVRALGRLGFARVVMARELSRAQLEKIAGSTAVGLEVFVHGALCASYSGQCLMSSFMGGRSANRGKCAQPCRLPYSNAKPGGKSGVLLSLKDLCLIDYIRELCEMGIASLKIEGRMKGEDYVRAVVRAYRAALDGKPPTQKQKAEMLRVFDRGGYTDGYFAGNKNNMYMKALKNPYGHSAPRSDNRT